MSVLQWPTRPRHKLQLYILTHPSIGNFLTSTGLRRRSLSQQSISQSARNHIQRLPQVLCAIKGKNNWSLWRATLRFDRLWWKENAIKGGDGNRNRHRVRVAGSSDLSPTLDPWGKPSHPAALVFDIDLCHCGGLGVVGFLLVASRVVGHGVCWVDVIVF